MEKAAGDAEYAGEQTYSEDENIIDRVFSPLDNAVREFNRDLNVKDGASGD